jgi:Transmembrane domain of unknown function (DUF3566)
VDEAGRSTPPPLIMTPPGPGADPDGQAADTFVDNGAMASSRTRSESSLSAAVKRVNGTNGSAASEAVSPAAEVSDSDPDTGVRATAEPNGTARASSVPPGLRETTQERAVTDGDRAPSASTPAPAAPAVPTETAAPYRDAPPVTPPYAGPGTGYADPQPGYRRPDWSPNGTDSTAVPPPYPGVDNGSSGPGFASGATSAVTGAAAGLASSVTSAWQKRGSSDKPKVTAAKPKPKRKPAKRQAMLTLARVEPWSVMKFSFVASVVAFIILFVAVAVLYMVLSALGVFDSLQNTVTSITSSQGTGGTNISHWFSASLILGYTALLGALNIVLITAMATIGSVVYNLIAKTIGGVEVTLRETD